MVLIWNYKGTKYQETSKGPNKSPREAFYGLDYVNEPNMVVWVCLGTSFLIFQPFETTSSFFFKRIMFSLRSLRACLYKVFLLRILFFFFLTDNFFYQKKILHIVMEMASESFTSFPLSPWIAHIFLFFLYISQIFWNFCQHIIFLLTNSCCYHLHLSFSLTISSSLSLL